MVFIFFRRISSSKPSAKTYKISYQAEKPPKSPRPDKLSNTVTHQAELSFQATLRWPHLPSILVDLKPVLLICNMCACEVLLKSVETSCLYRLAPKQSLSPLYVQVIEFSKLCQDCLLYITQNDHYGNSWKYFKFGNSLPKES